MKRKVTRRTNKLRGNNNTGTNQNTLLVESAIEFMLFCCDHPAVLLSRARGVHGTLLCYGPSPPPPPPPPPPFSQHSCIAAPPLWRESASCATCNRPFGVTRYRHHCRACGASVCQPHSTRARALPRLGFLTPVGVLKHTHPIACCCPVCPRTLFRLSFTDEYLFNEVLLVDEA